MGDRRRCPGRTLAVGLVAALDEAHAVLGEIPERVDHGVHGVHRWFFWLRCAAAVEGERSRRRDGEGNWEAEPDEVLRRV